MRKEACFTKFGDIMSDFEIAMSSHSLCMSCPFGNSLPVELLEFVNEHIILQKNRATRSSSHRVSVTLNGYTRASSHHWAEPYIVSNLMSLSWVGKLR